jgi:hypothetical protein
VAASGPNRRRPSEHEDGLDEIESPTPAPRRNQGKRMLLFSSDMEEPSPKRTRLEDVERSSSEEYDGFDEYTHSQLTGVP